MTDSSTLMVRLTAGAPDEALLAFTADLATRMKIGRVIGISASQPVVFYGSPDAYVPPQLVDWDRAQIDKELKQVESAFRSALDGKVPAVEWRSSILDYGSIVDFVAREMRSADLLVSPAAAAAGTVFDRTRDVDIADLALRIGKPILVVGSGVRHLDLRSAVIAWKDSKEARRAVQDSLPLLALADRITVVEVTSDDSVAAAEARTADVARWLTRHGLSASSRVDRSEGNDAAQLAAIVRRLGAGLLVGGAYGHARLREWVLGGVTRELLLRPVGASLVSH
ncbi:MAG: universal stress protein [Reyranellaceae bacterium]